jgi:hypothetical protein
MSRGERGEGRAKAAIDESRNGSPGFAKVPQSLAAANKCRYRSGWVPLFRTSGYHLSGCGAIRLIAACQRRPGIEPACQTGLRQFRGYGVK